jgi:amino acid permease
MKKIYSLLLVVCAVLSLIIAVIYFSKTAGSLPHFFPGYSLGSNHKHTKHGIVFIALAIVFVLGAWMASGPGAHAGPTGDDA